MVAFMGTNRGACAVGSNHESRQRRTFNIERPTSHDCPNGTPLDVECWMLDVGCLLLVPSFQVRKMVPEKSHPARVFMNSPASSGGGPGRLLIVDGHAYAYRAFFAIRSLHSPSGQATNAIYGFVKMLAKMRERL